MSIEAEVMDADTFEHVSEPAGRVVGKAGQSLATRQEQNNAPAAVTPMDMIDRALVAGADPATLEKLLALQERWEANQGRKAFDEAMAAAKAEIPTIRKNRTVDFTSQKGRTHYKHEDLAEIAATVNPILGKYGLSYRFKTTNAPNEPITVTCVITHRMGYYEETTLSGPRDDSGNKNAIQQVGSTLTYLQRMTLKAALGLAAGEDDDGRASGTGQETISEQQVIRIRELLEATGSDTPHFCEVWKIDALPSMHPAAFPAAVQMLETKLVRLNQKAAS
jgi:hypothetical protein